VEEIEDTDTSKGSRDDIGEDGGSRAGIHGLEFPKHVVKLRQAVDNHEDVADFQLLRVPEHHPSSNTNIPQCIIRHKIGHLIQFHALRGLLRIELVEAVQPCELKELLGEEEATDEVRLRGPEREVGVVNV